MGAEVGVEGLKWVLTSRNATWTISSELLELIWELDSRNAEWIISSDLKSIWQLDSRDSNWKL